MHPSRLTFVVIQAALAALVPAYVAGNGVDPNPLHLAPDHATASVADLDKESEWYEHVLGFQELSRGGQADFQVRHLGIPGYRIDLVWQKGSARPHGAGASVQGWFHVVFKTDAVEADYKRLVALGTDAKADRDAQSNISRLVFHDPEGNEVEIVPDPPLPSSTTMQRSATP